MENTTEFLDIFLYENTTRGISVSYLPIGVDPIDPIDGATREIYPLPAKIAICVVLSLMIVTTIAGNVFVIAAILLERSLRAVSNYLIMSLAVTDLMVAILVMPISVVNEVSADWNLGGLVCDMWIGFDVLCCTASILHLVAIAFDRYWAVSNIDYIRRRCARQIGIMVLAVWVVAVTISIPPLFGWKDGNDPGVTKRCMISQDLGYTIFSTLGAFYFPLILMLVLNIKIYVAARTRIRKRGFYGYRRPAPASAVTVTVTEGHNLSPNSSGSDVSQDRFSAYNGSCLNMDELSRMQHSAGELTEEEHPTFTPSSAAVVVGGVVVVVENNNASGDGAGGRRTEEEDAGGGGGSGGGGVEEEDKVGGAAVAAALGSKGPKSRKKGGSSKVPDISCCCCCCCVRNSNSNSDTFKTQPPPTTATTITLTLTTTKEATASSTGPSSATAPTAPVSVSSRGSRTCETQLNQLLLSVPSPSSFSGTASSGCSGGGGGGGGGGSSGGKPLLTPRGHHHHHHQSPRGGVGRTSAANANANANANVAKRQRQRRRERERERAKKKKEKMELRRERRAARVIAIITGGFMACWLPFFLVALIGPFCGRYCYFPPALISVFLWLGYLNSLLNPIIYTIFNPSFRTAFKKLVFGKYRIGPHCR